ncbi:MAG: hypothetical protein IJB24_00370, partial [Clostridia bacterium]|nr:hypothetical protein [Clostridia bacterium]
MKIAVRIAALVLCMLMLLPTFVFGYAGEVEQNPAVSMPKATPVVDGFIEYEAWSDPAYLNDTTCGRFWDINEPTSTAELYFAYDDNGLYFAADITDSDPANGFVPSTGYDNIDNSGSSKPYGFNGDVMNLMLDPLGVFEKNTQKQTTPWYNIGIFADNSVKVYRSQVNEKDITSSVTAKGEITDHGWRFEICIPWSVIVADVSAQGLSVTQVKLATVGSVSRAACMYMDRYYTESGSVSTWGRFITVCEKTYDGTNGCHTSGVDAKSYGIILNHTELHKHLWSDWTVADPTCTANGTKSRVCTTCGATESEVLGATGHSEGETVTVDAACTADGSVTTYCSVCNAVISVQVIRSEGHKFSDWQTVTEPTDTDHGLMRRTCSVCDTSEDKLIPATGAPAVLLDNYTMSVTLADEIKDIRFALGTYTKPADIKAAEGNIAIDNKTLVKGTVDGIYSYELKCEGVYTVWVRMKDGKEYFIPFEVKDIKTYLTSYGVKITVNDLRSDVKDFFIAKGEYTTYSEVKENRIVNVTSEKIAGKHDYTYTVSEPGVHTVLIRYNDGSLEFQYITLTVDEPVFTDNGLQVIISNIPDLKVIRTAYGVYTTPGDTKRAPGARNFSNKAVVKDADPYTLQYREEGMITVVVEYNNGYISVHHYNVQKKAPTFELSDKTVTFGNLGGMTVMRYAPGEYSTSADIKNAPGSQYIRGSEIQNNSISITLENGTYSFVVQYDDDRYFYKTVTITEEIVPTATSANVSKAFTSNMMFQRDEPISVWGWAPSSNEGKIITATLGDMFGWATVKNGEWKITFPETLPATTDPLLLTV